MNKQYNNDTSTLHAKFFTVILDREKKPNLIALFGITRSGLCFSSSQCYHFFKKFNIKLYSKNLAFSYDFFCVGGVAERCVVAVFCFHLLSEGFVPAKRFVCCQSFAQSKNDLQKTVFCGVAQQEDGGTCVKGKSSNLWSQSSWKGEHHRKRKHVKDDIDTT